jgi:hypothetical protein
MRSSTNLRTLVFATISLAALLSACSHSSALPTPAQGLTGPSMAGSRQALSAGATSPSGIYVSNYTGNTITVFATNAHGNAKPIRTIIGTYTGLNSPLHISADKAGDLYVANRVTMTVTVYPPSSRGNQQPSRVLATSAMNSPASPLVDPNDKTGSVYVANCAGCVGSGINAVFHFPKGATSPDFSIAGSKTGLTAASGIGIDAKGDVYVGNSSGGVITVYAKGAKGNAAPIRTLKPPDTLDIQQIVYANGAIYIADVSGVYVYPSMANGSPKASTFFSNQQMGITGPGAIFVTATAKNPTIYIADYSGNAVAVLQTTGKSPKLTLKSKFIITGSRTTMNGPTGIWLIP